MNPMYLQYVYKYMDKYETADRYSGYVMLCYALFYVLDLCTLYKKQAERERGCFFNMFIKLWADQLSNGY